MFTKSWNAKDLARKDSENHLLQILDEDNYDVQSTVSILKFENEGEIHKYRGHDTISVIIYHKLC